MNGLHRARAAKSGHGPVPPRGGALKSALWVLVVFGAAAFAVWTWLPELLPLELRRQNPNSPDYAPWIYKWKDAQGRVQLTDTPPPEGMPFERIRLDPEQNVVPGYRPR